MTKMDDAQLLLSRLRSAGLDPCVEREPPIPEGILRERVNAIVEAWAAYTETGSEAAEVASALIVVFTTLPYGGKVHMMNASERHWPRSMSGGET